jgi:hypothetical protein
MKSPALNWWGVPISGNTIGVFQSVSSIKLMLQVEADPDHPILVEKSMTKPPKKGMVS